jgi:hypothetical protein
LHQLLAEEFECQGICHAGNYWLYPEEADIVTGKVPGEFDGCLYTIKREFEKGALAGCLVLFFTAFV